MFLWFIIRWNSHNKYKRGMSYVGNVNSIPSVMIIISDDVLVLLKKNSLKRMKFSYPRKDKMNGAVRCVIKIDQSLPTPPIDAAYTRQRKFKTNQSPSAYIASNLLLGRFTFSGYSSSVANSHFFF